jgi:hypothetical protein
VYRLPRYDMQEHRPAAHVGKEMAQRTCSILHVARLKVESNMSLSQELQGLGA